MPIIGSQGAWQGQDRLDEAARHAVQFAEALGAEYGQRQSAPDMLLLALLDDHDAVPARALLALDVELDAVGVEINRVVKRRGPPLDGRSALDADAREAVILGVNEARRAGFNQAGGSWYARAWQSVHCAISSMSWSRQAYCPTLTSLPPASPSC